MSTECIFCGGACGRVCRGLGFKSDLVLDAEPATKPRASRKDAGRTAGSIPATGANSAGDRLTNSAAARGDDVRETAGLIVGKPPQAEANQAPVGPTSSDGSPDSRIRGSAPRMSIGEQSPRAEMSSGNQSTPSDPIKRGRPLTKDAANSFERTKPWLAAGMSRSTWYNRRKAKHGN